MWRGTLTTGLARAELALDEARELELRWPPCSEGCPHSRSRNADRNKGTGSAELLVREQGGQPRAPGRKDRGECAEQAPLAKEDCVAYSCKYMPAKNRKKLVIISKEHRILG